MQEIVPNWVDATKCAKLGFAAKRGKIWSHDLVIGRIEYFTNKSWLHSWIIEIQGRRPQLLILCILENIIVILYNLFDL
jgi:hypothetical protein